MPRIEQMYAFVCEDSGPEDEGVIATQTSSGMMPLVGADMARVESMRAIAETIARSLGKPVKLLRFTTREEVEIIRAQ